MKVVICLVALAAVYVTVESKTSPPKVQVYCSGRGEFGVNNTLICQVSDFHPPDITITLLKDGKEIPDAQQTDLAFRENWHFHLTKTASFTPQREDEYSCRVEHGQTSNDYAWEPNM